MAKELYHESETQKEYQTKLAIMKQSRKKRTESKKNCLENGNVADLR